MLLHVYSIPATVLDAGENNKGTWIYRGEKQVSFRANVPENIFEVLFNIIMLNNANILSFKNFKNV